MMEITRKGTSHAVEEAQARGDHREAPLMVRADQFFVHRQHVGQDAESAEWIDALEGLEHGVRDCLATHAMTTVASHDEFAVETLLARLAGPGHMILTPARFS